MKFTPISVDAFQPVLPLVQQEKQNECGFSIAPLYCPYSDGKFTIYNDICVVLYTENGETHCNLLGKPDKTSYSTIIDTLLEKYPHIQFHYLSKEKAQLITSLFPGSILIDDPDLYDYFYKIEDFIRLEGKENQKKRSQYNQFKSANQVIFEPITEDNLKDCKMVTLNWCARKDCMECKYTCEQKIIFDLLDNWNKYPCRGGILYTDDEPAAFLIGEKVGDTVFGYHQKTCAEIKGLGYAVYIETLKNIFSDCAYFNFGPDLGLPGLRQYKRSFKPYTLEPKFTVKF